MSDWAERLAPARAWWQSLAARERTLVAGAAALLVVVLAWTLAIAPAWRTLARAPAEIEAAERQLQSMQRLAAEARELRATPPIDPAKSAAALQAATDRLGDRARLVLQGERAVLTLSGVGSSALRDWLAEVRSGARARPVEASLARAENGWTGSIVLALGGAP